MGVHRARSRSAPLSVVDFGLDGLSRYMLWGILESIAGFAHFWVLHTGGWNMGDALLPTNPLYGRSFAAFFTAIVVSQVAIVMIWRTTRQSVISKGIPRNRAVVAGVSIEILLLLLIVESGVGHRAFGTQPPALMAWANPAVLALLMLALSESLKAARSRARIA